MIVSNFWLTFAKSNKIKRRDMSKEVWKDVVGYEGLYQVSSIGRVKSLPKSGSGGHLESIILKQNTDKGGYKWKYKV